MRLATPLTAALLTAGLLAGCGGEDSSGPAPTPSTSEPTTPVTTPPASSSPASATPAEPTSPTATPTPEPAGAGVAYVVDGVLHATDGTTQPLRATAGQQLSGFALLPDGRVVVSQYDDEGALTLEVGDAAKRAAYPVLGRPVVGLAGYGVAWLGPGGVVNEIEPNASRPTQLGRVSGRDATAAALIGEDCFTEAEPTDSYCGVVVNLEGAKPSAVLSALGRVEAYAAGVQVVTDVSRDRTRAAGVVSQSDDGVCSAVVDPVSGTTVWRSCRFADLHFSPDGAHVVATRSDVDGLGPNVVFVLDAATGEPVGRYRATVIPQAVWEDAKHLVVSSYDGADWTLQRVALDGSADPVADPVAGEAESPAYLLPLG